MFLSDKRSVVCLRSGLWTGAVLAAIAILSLVVCGILALAGDQSGRGAALALSLTAFLGLFLDIAFLAGLLSLNELRRLQTGCEHSLEDSELE